MDVPPAPPSQPSERQREVLLMAAHGTSNAEIASGLGLSSDDVLIEWRAIYAFYGVRNRVRAVVTAMLCGHIAPEPKAHWRFPGEPDTGTAAPAMVEDRYIIQEVERLLQSNMH